MAVSERVEYLYSPKTIRERAQKIFALAEKGETSFDLDLKQLEKLAELVVSEIKQRYPKMDIPFHSRFGHFQAGGVDRLGSLNQSLEKMSELERCRSKLDLCIASVLLDAGAGMQWSYRDHNGLSFDKSEGLAVASFNMFTSGIFSSHPEESLRVDGARLIKLKSQALAQGFQVGDKNPMVGLEGRTSLLQELGRQLISGKYQYERPSDLILSPEVVRKKSLRAQEVLHAYLIGLGNIWPGRPSLDGAPLGDTWDYPLPNAKNEERLIPFHKLSQWLSYSSIEALIQSGFKVDGVEELTGLAEYRNGGLFIDGGALKFKHREDEQKLFKPSDKLVIEWRALTIVLLDRLAPMIRQKLGKTEKEWPLVKILEGGTWHAGRRLAREKRADGGPPVRIESDGTVF